MFLDLNGSFAFVLFKKAVKALVNSQEGGGVVVDDFAVVGFGQLALFNKVGEEVVQTEGEFGA